MACYILISRCAYFWHPRLDFGPHDHEYSCCLSRQGDYGCGDKATYRPEWLSTSPPRTCTALNIDGGEAKVVGHAGGQTVLDFGYGKTELFPSACCVACPWRTRDNEDEDSDDDDDDDASLSGDETASLGTTVFGATRVGTARVANFGPRDCLVRIAAARRH